MNAITMLKNDHRTVEELFRRFESLGPRAMKGRRDVVDRIVSELSTHAAIEEMVLYPAARSGIADRAVEALVLEGLEEHHVVKWTLSELDGLDPAHERFDAKVKVLIESVRRHVKEEEKELFPALSKACSRAFLDELGESLAKAKKSAPTHPHPRSPDEPPDNILSATGAAVIDKARDAGRAMVRKTLAKR